jgi:DNA-binding beta-propeller fold protein YncE
VPGFHAENAILKRKSSLIFVEEGAMLRKLSAGLCVCALAALSSHAADAGELPPLRCTTVSVSDQTCDWTNTGQRDPDQHKCTWEEDGTPTVCAPLSKGTIRLRTAGTYRGGYNNAGASAGVAYDAKTHRLFVANKPTQTVDVVSLSGEDGVNADHPHRLAKECSISIAGLEPRSPSGDYVPARVAVGNDGILVVVLQQKEDATRQGKIALLDARRVKEGEAPGGACSAPPLRVIDVGFMPTQPSFTADGKYLLVTNQGEPSQDYLNDPLGSVSIIDLKDGIAGAKETARVTFEPFNRLKAWLIARGVRITGPDLSTPDPLDTTSVARDLEPEGIAISADSRFAWITLPENNAVATLDIRRGGFLAIRSFGSKDYDLEGNGLDPTDNDNGTDREPHIRTWPIRGMYMPKQVAIAAPRLSPVFVYPNRGVRRNLEAFKDEVRLSNLLKGNGNPLARLRLKVSRVDGDPAHVYAFGGRSFAIRSLDNSLIFDSGDDFERITAQAWRDTHGYFLFNTPDDENSFDENSDLRGPEPVSVATGRIGLRTYAFIGLERVGGVMTYDITNPFKPTFQYYINNRNFALNPKDKDKNPPGIPARPCKERVPESEQCANVGDQSAEQILFIGAGDSPIGTPLLVVSNATSGSATIFRIDRIGD